MTLVPLIMATAAAVVIAGQAPVTFADSVVASGRDVRLSEVANLIGLPADVRNRAKDLIVVRLAAGQSAVDVSSSRLAQRARAQLPILTRYLSVTEDHVVSIRLQARAKSVDLQATPAVGACMVVLRPIAVGAAPTISDLGPAPCGGKPALRAFGYDRTRHVALAIRPLEPGETVAAIPSSSLAAVRAGDAFVVTARVGPVSVERRVTAVQSARPGERMFVVDQAGQVFAAPQPDGPDAP